MNISRCESYVRELQAVVAQCEQFQSQIDQKTGFLAIATKMNDVKQAQTFVEQRTQLQQALAAASEVAANKANRTDLEACRTLVSDLAARCGFARDEYDQWRQEIAEFEFQLAAGAEIDRAAAEAMLERAKKRVELRVKLASDLIPDKPIIIGA